MFQKAANRTAPVSRSHFPISEEWLTDSKLREALFKGKFQPVNVEITAHLESIPTNIWGRESMLKVDDALKRQIEIGEMVGWQSLGSRSGDIICECLSGELMNFPPHSFVLCSSVEAKGDLYLTTLPACTLDSRV